MYTLPPSTLNKDDNGADIEVEGESSNDDDVEMDDESIAVMNLNEPHP